MSDHLEVEDKYDVEEGHSVPDLTSVRDVLAVDPVTMFTLRATYFDTASGDLGRHGVALRRREGGKDDGWHIKASEPGGKREFTVPLTSDLRVPGALIRALEPFTVGAELNPIATLETRRRGYLLRDAETNVLAELVDDRVIGSLINEEGRPSVVAQWREWEVELIDGGPALLVDVAPILIAAGAKRSDSASKLARVLARPGLASAHDPQAAGATIASLLKFEGDKGTQGRPPII